MDARASLFRNWRDSSLRAQGKEVGGTEQVQVRPSGEGRGLGLFASRQFGVGECVLREGPLLRWSSNAGTAVAVDADATPSQGTPDIFQLSAKWLEAQLAQLPAEDQSAYYGLSCRPDLLDKGRSLAIWVSNALPADEENENGHTDTSAVYRVACRVNHACGANCAHAWSRSRQQLTLHAVRPIAAGEELTINYLGGGNGARARPERQAALGGLGFCCACGVCALPPAEVAESDARRARVAALSELLQQEKGPQGARSYEECAGTPLWGSEPRLA